MRPVALLALLCAPGVASAASYTVCPVSAGTCDFTTLTLAHTGASDGDTLTITASLTEAAAVSITKDLTIVGGGTSRPSISLTTGATTLTFEAGAVASLSGVKVVPGTSRAIEVKTKAKVTFDDILVESASKGVDGVGMNVNDGTVTITDSTFQSLTSSTGKGGAINLSNAATVASFANVTFSGNHATTDGGAVYADGVKLTITDCTFTSNTATDDAGALYLKGGGGVFAVTGSTFSSNTASDAGGAAYTEASTVTWTTTTFSDNDTTSGNGGALYQSTGGCTYDACTFDTNTAGGTYGGDIRSNDSDVTVRNGTTFGGSSADYGGAIAMSAGATLSVSDAIFEACAADQFGGHIHTLSDATIDGSSFTGGTASYRGGSIDIDTAVLTVTDSTFTDNASLLATANSYGGGAIAFENDADGTIGTSSFDGNEAANDGGAIYVYDGDDVSVADCTFTSNSGGVTGGGITAWTDSSLDVAGSTFTANDAPYGGAISAWEWSASVGLDVSDSTLISNTSSTAGGAIYVNVGDALSVTDSTFTTNDAYVGGAVYVYDNTGAALTAYRNWFCENASDTDGGALWLNSLDTGQTHRVASNFFVENTAADEGGALYVSSSTSLDVLNNHVIANQAASAKGGGVASGQIDFVDNLVAYTTAGDGFRSSSTSGTYQYGGWYSNTSANISGSLTTLDSSNVTGSDPLLFDYTTGDGCSAVDLRVRVSGPLVDKGSTASAYNDKDGTRSDIGAFGGAYADPDWWVDGDGDGTRWVYDCDDADATIEPGATETCDGIDEDCDGTVDEGATTGTSYADTDGDGYGDAAKASSACPMPSGYVGTSGDCDDSTSAIKPGATETCNGKDDDCDGTIDDGVGTLFYADADGDGYGDPSAKAVSACSAPTGYVANSSDCDDTSSSVKPGGTESCNGKDDDCDGAADEGEGYGTPWYADADSDGHGAVATTKMACSAPSGYVASSDDCDDGAESVYPGATETCDGADQDCDGTADDGAIDPSTWYADDDADGFGDLSSTASACTAPSGYVADASDCDDAVKTVFPGASEYCNGVDDDCDGAVDDSVVTYTFYADDDGDGFGDGTSTVDACAPPSGYVADATDCDDTDGTVGGPTAWYADTDGDGFGDALTSTVACDAPSGYVADGTDCDDTDDTAPDGWWWYADSDDDGLGDASSAEYECSAPSGYVADDTDCNDADFVVGGPSTWYWDLDADGYGDPGATTDACDQPADYVADATDCDDTNGDVHPGAIDQCRNLVDDDCDGAVDEEDVLATWYADSDGDGWGDDATTALDCAAPSGYVGRGGDCEDDDLAVNPDAVELCNGADDDCDGTIDDGAEGVTWYTDADGDGYGDDDATVISCGQPTGAVDQGGDCDDQDGASHPGAEDVPNDGVDQDCDGADATATYPDESSRQWTPDTGVVDEKGAGCGCTSGGAPSGAWLAVLLLAWRRRRTPT